MWGDFAETTAFERYGVKSSEKANMKKPLSALAYHIVTPVTADTTASIGVITPCVSAILLKRLHLRDMA